VRRELCRFCLTGGRFDQLAEFLTLLFRDRSQEVLNLRDALPHKRHNGNIRDSRNPGVADQLEIQRGQSLGLVGITSTRGFPFKQTLRAVQVANGIDVGHKLDAVGERADNLLLHVAFGLADANTVIPGTQLADRGNDRVQVIDKDGNFKTQCLQFGKPSAVALDNKGNIYVAEGMSDAHSNPEGSGEFGSQISKPDGSGH
jgi:hypothetical protein